VSEEPTQNEQGTRQLKNIQDRPCSTFISRGCRSEGGKDATSHGWTWRTPKDLQERLPRATFFSDRRSLFRSLRATKETNRFQKINCYIGKIVSALSCTLDSRDARTWDPSVKQPHGPSVKINFDCQVSTAQGLTSPSGYSQKMLGGSPQLPIASAKIGAVILQPELSNGLSLRRVITCEF
jgi:hypothetical protein